MTRTLTPEEVDKAIKGVQAALLEAFGGSDDVVWEHWTKVVEALQDRRPPATGDETP